jgi:hypothetical protein
MIGHHGPMIGPSISSQRWSTSSRRPDPLRPRCSICIERSVGFVPTLCFFISIFFLALLLSLSFVAFLFFYFPLPHIQKSKKVFSFILSIFVLVFQNDILMRPRMGVSPSGGHGCSQRLLCLLQRANNFATMERSLRYHGGVPTNEGRLTLLQRATGLATTGVSGRMPSGIPPKSHL